MPIGRMITVTEENESRPENAMEDDFVAAGDCHDEKFTQSAGFLVPTVIRSETMRVHSGRGMRC